MGNWVPDRRHFCPMGRFSTRAFVANVLSPIQGQRPLIKKSVKDAAAVCGSAYLQHENFDVSTGIDGFNVGHNVA